MMGEVEVSVGAKNKSEGAWQEGEHWAAVALQSSEPGLTMVASSSLIWSGRAVLLNRSLNPIRRR